MTLSSDNIKILQAEIMADTTDGGGRMTAVEVPAGSGSLIFGKSSEVDRAYGRMKLRKIYAAVMSANDDTLYGLHGIISRNPEDPHLSATLFSTANWYDQRTAARDAIERYLARSSAWNGTLLQIHYAGQRSITLFQRPENPLPSVGDVFSLGQNLDQTNGYEQYVRITKVADVLQTFGINVNGNIINTVKRLVTCDISDPLRYDFEGIDVSLYDVNTVPARLYTTRVANATVYHASKPLKVAAHVNDYTIKIESPYQQLVPSARTEIAAVDLNAAGVGAALTACGGSYSLAFSTSLSPSIGLYLGLPVMPGSLAIAYSGGTLTDSGEGELKSGSTVVGTVSYPDGVVRMVPGSPTYGGSKTATFIPAAAPITPMQSAEIAITIANRALTYAITLSPSPAPGTLRISYRALGKWYTLADTGAGACRGGDSSYGIATLSFISGSVAVTLGALPDIGSSVLFQYANSVEVFDRSGSTVYPAKWILTTVAKGWTPGYLELTWPNPAGGSFTATDDGHGNLTGDATGQVRYALGEIWFTPTYLPAAGTIVTVTGQNGTPKEKTFTAPSRNIDHSIDLDMIDADVLPGSVELEFNTLIENYDPEVAYYVTKIDPIVRVHDVSGGGFSGDVDGSINYTGATLNFVPEIIVSMPKANYSYKLAGANLISGYLVTTVKWTFDNFGHYNAGAAMPIDETGYAKVTYRTAGGAPATEYFTLANPQIDLTYQYAEDVIPGSVAFHIGGHVYYDRTGSLYTDIDPATGAGTFAGTLDYSSGLANLAVWTPNASNAPGLYSLGTRIGASTATQVVFRTPAAPIIPGGLSIVANKVGTGTVSATADNNGVLSAAGVYGHANFDTGVVDVMFGTWVVAAGNETQIWYDADLIREDGKIFRPEPVYVDTLKFNATMYTYLPLNADILGLDPVRLPSDGRVVCYMVGNLLVIHHTGTLALSTVVAGRVDSAGRDRLAWLRVYDANGLECPTGVSTWTADLDAGTITWSDSPSLGTYLQPFTLENRIEDMLLCTDVQIDGNLALRGPISHEFPAEETIVSSALLMGDVAARVTNIFDQAAWTGVWSDARIGNPALATYNTLTYPFAVRNDGCQQERWVIIFTSSTLFNCIGENSGQIATGISISGDFSPINPATQQPYFTILSDGWGSGWSAGQCVRFNTLAANYPIWAALTILQGPTAYLEDHFNLAVRGDA